MRELYVKGVNKLDLEILDVQNQLQNNQNSIRIINQKFLETDRDGNPCVNKIEIIAEHNDPSKSYFI